MVWLWLTYAHVVVHCSYVLDRFDKTYKHRAASAAKGAAPAAPTPSA